MAELLTSHVAQRPAEVAVVDATGETTWAALDERVNRWINVLRGAGLGRGDRVAVLCGNRREAFEVTLACLHTGLTLVPVNWYLTATEISYVLTDSGSRALLVDADRAPAGAAAIEGLETPLALRSVFGASPESGFGPAEEALAAASASEPEGQCSGSVLLYTSGTSGRPKGAVTALFQVGAPMAAVAGLLEAIGLALHVPARGRVLLVGPWYHSGQLFFSVFPLLRGCPLVMCARFDPADVLSLIDRHAITHAHLVPIHFSRLVGLPVAARAGFRGDSLEVVWHGASPCPVDVKFRMIDWWGPVLVEYYAATEGGVATLIDSAHWLDRPGSVGRPVPPTEIVIIADDGTPSPPNTDGQIYLRRPPQRGFHYHNAPEKTREAHLDDRTFTVGDVGHLDDDGYLYLTGRSTDMVITGGVNVYPVEVENILLDHDAVRDVAVFGIPDDEYGERVIAAVVLADTADGDVIAELDQHCRRSLAGFKVPRSYEIVADLPREPSGKLRKHLLRDAYAAASV